MHFPLIDHTAIIELITLVIGFAIGVGSRFGKGIGVFLQVALLVAKIAKWYFETHPNGKRAAKQTRLDEKLDRIYHEKLAKHDPHKTYQTTKINPAYKEMIGLELTKNEKQTKKS